MKKLLSIISIILVIATIFTITGCSKKETNTNPTDGTSQTGNNQTSGENNQVEDKENYVLSFTLNFETEQGFKMKIPNKYKEQITVTKKNNESEIYFSHSGTNLLIFKILVSDAEMENNIKNVKIGNYFINAFIGDEVNKESADGKLIFEIQEQVKDFMSTITEIKGKEEVKDNQSNDNNNSDKDSDKDNQVTDKNGLQLPENTPDELKDAEIGEEVQIRNSLDTAVKNEDGSITYYYYDENGEKQSYTVHPKPDKPDKPIQITIPKQ